jgi:hypothetical protein
MRLTDNREFGLADGFYQSVCVADMGEELVSDRGSGRAARQR